MKPPNSVIVVEIHRVNEPQLARCYIRISTTFYPFTLGKSGTCILFQSL